MTELTLRAQVRTALGKATKTLRHTGFVPAVLYGHGLASRPLTVGVNDMQRVYRTAGESTLVDLVVGEQPPVKVIIQDVQRHPVSDQILHVDFHQVRMTEKLHTDIPLGFTGEAPAVKELGGVLVKNLNHVKVEALPGDLVHEISIDVSPLKTFEDIIHVRDLVLPKGIAVLDRPDEVVCLVTPPRSEKELEELETKVEEKVEEVEGVKKEEPTEEDAAPADAEKPKKQPEEK